MSQQIDISEALSVLRAGGVIAYPTDTVWGLGCDATSARAVARIYEIKKRCEAKSMLTLVGSIGQLERWIDGIPDVAYELLEAAVEPLTIVFDGSRGLAPNLPAADGSIGVRLTSDDCCRRMCLALGRPIVSTSANVSGASAPQIFPEIAPELLAMTDYVAQWRRDDLTRRKPSTVIRLTADAEIKILRK